MPVETIRWEGDRLRLIDQTRLPTELSYIDCRDVETVAEAIVELRVRGAPAIGIAAAYGVVMAALAASQGGNQELFAEHVRRAIQRLRGTRPTAVNLFWALNRMERALEDATGAGPEAMLRRLRWEADAILEEDRSVCRRLGRNGAELIEDGMSVLTHCNAGGLATADYGTALGMIYSAVESGKRVRVYADETRPLLQGARLTAWELKESDIDVTVICDNMAASLMRKGLVDCVIVGADRIAMNGDVANKIGTYGLGVLAHHHRLPFYVAAPVSTIDAKTGSGEGIPIEMRHPEEVTAWFGKQIAPSGIGVYNPAFDVTPHALISAIISERGIARAPYPPVLQSWVGGLAVSS